MTKQVNFMRNVLRIVFFDNIFTNVPRNCSASGLLFTEIPDHLPIFTILSDNCKNTSKNIYVTFRDKNANNMAAFLSRA